AGSGPVPAASESPSSNRRIGSACAGKAKTRETTSRMKIRQCGQMKGFRIAVRGPYRAAMEAIAPPPVPAAPIEAANTLVQVRDLRLTVPSAAGPVNILRGIDLDVDAG